MSGAALHTRPEAGFDHLVYVRIVEACNLHCEHCFIPANPKRMQMSDIETLPGLLRERIPAGNRILLQWHGGEPTLLGPDWLRAAIDTVESLAPEMHWLHGIQTNLMTYSPAWAALYHSHFGGEVGVSWDPEIRLTRAGRPETHQDFEAAFWPALDALVADGLSPYLVVTGTRVFFERFRNPFAFFDLLASHGVHKAHIERLTPTGYARAAWGRLGVDNGGWSRKMGRFARAYALWRQQRQADGLPTLHLSPFDGLFESVTRLRTGAAAGGYGCWSGACDTRFHTVDASGYKAGCTALTSEVDNRRAGVVQIYDRETMRRERVADCVACPFRAICNTGCLATPSIDASGECSGGRGLFEVVRGIHARQDCGVVALREKDV